LIYFIEASWCGLPIVLQQLSVESPKIFALLQSIFKDGVESVQERSKNAGISDEDFENFLQYIILFYGNVGNYLSFGDTKFIVSSFYFLEKNAYQ
jgi:dipeptidyl-peptidase III